MDSDSTFQGTSYDPVPGGSMASATVDVHGTVVAWSLGAQWLFGYLPSEAVGRPITEVFGLGGPAPIDFASYPAAWVGEVNAHARDGTPLPLQLYAHPLHGPQGIVHWYLTILDRSASQENQPPVEDPDLAHLREWTLAQSPLPVAIFNHKGQLAEMNDSDGPPLRDSRARSLGEAATGAHPAADLHRIRRPCGTDPAGREADPPRGAQPVARGLPGTCLDAVLCAAEGPCRAQPGRRLHGVRHL